MLEIVATTMHLKSAYVHVVTFCGTAFFLLFGVKIEILHSDRL